MTLVTWNDGYNTVVVDPSEVVGMVDQSVVGGESYLTTIILRGGGEVTCHGSVGVVCRRLSLKTERAMY